MSETTSLNLYSGQPQHANFSRMKELFPVANLESAGSPHPFPAGSPIELPEAFPFEGVTRPTEDFIHATDTSAILVVKEGEIRFEQYALTGHAVCTTRFDRTSRL